MRTAVADLSIKYRRDHCGLVRAGCAFLLHVCEDEHGLFNQFFVATDDSSEALTSFLEGLCQVLYDTLRPLVIHLHHLETLSELTGILRSEMLGHHCATHPKHLAAFETIVDQLLQDIQERLVYRAHIYIRNGIFVLRDNNYTDTVFPAYSDTLGTREKCHCKQVNMGDPDMSKYLPLHSGPIYPTTLPPPVTWPIQRSWR